MLLVWEWPENYSTSNQYKFEADFSEIYDYTDKNYFSYILNQNKGENVKYNSSL